MSNAFAQFPGGPASVMPSQEDVSRVQTSLGGSYSSAADFSLSLRDRAMGMGAGSINTDWLERGLGAAMAGATSSMDAGISSIHRRGDQAKHYAIMAKPRREYGAWDDGGFDEQVMIWSAARDDPKTTRSGHYVENICGINYYCELAVVIQKQSSIVSRQQVPYLQRQFSLDSHYSPTSARDYRSKWKLLHSIQRPPEGTFNGQDVLDSSGSTGERLIPYVYDGRSKTRNLFSTNVRKGENLFFVCTKIQNPYSQMFMPNGQVSTMRSGTAGESLLQVRGWSSSEMSYVPVDSSGGEGKDPLDTDANYVDFRNRVATIATRVDWDDDKGTFSVKNVAREEGIQESLEYMTSVEYEALKEGSTEHVGIAIDTENGLAPSQAALDLAHRSPAAMSQLQTVEYLVTRRVNTYN